MVSTLVTGMFVFIKTATPLALELKDDDITSPYPIPSISYAPVVSDVFPV